MMTQENPNDKLSIFMIKKLFMAIKKVNYKINQAQLTQQVGALFSDTLQQSINEIQLPEFTKIGEKDLQTYSKNILEINQLCFDHLIQVIFNQQKQSQYSEQQQANKNIFNKKKTFSIRDYQSLQQAVQKAQQQVRKHIGIEHQMKICLQQVQQQLSELMIDNEGLRKQLVFLKKQLAMTKKKELQLAQGLNQAEQRVIYLENNKLGGSVNIKNNSNNKRSKLYTQPSREQHLNQQQRPTIQLIKQNVNNDSSKKLFEQLGFQSMKKQKSLKSQQQNIINNSNKKRPTITKLHTQQSHKLGSRKHSKLIVMDNNNYDANNMLAKDNLGALSSFVTLSMQKKKTNCLFSQELKDNQSQYNNNQSQYNNNKKDDLVINHARINNNNTNNNTNANINANTYTNSNTNNNTKTNTNSRQLFWNKRLKNKQSIKSGNGLYSDLIISQQPYSNNRSLNISPRRQLNKKQLLSKQSGSKQRQRYRELKNAYAINVRDTNNQKYSHTLSSLANNNQETVMRRKCQQHKQLKQSQRHQKPMKTHTNCNINNHSNNYFKQQFGSNSYYYIKNNPKPDSFIQNNNSNNSYKIYDRSKSMAY